MRGRVREVVIYFKFHENRSRGLRAVEGRKSPSPIDLAHGFIQQLVLPYKPWYVSSTRQFVFIYQSISFTLVTKNIGLKQQTACSIKFKARVTINI